jgi:Histidine kinase-, DNA gyrase B-, and HSP90-like ATPase
MLIDTRSRRISERVALWWCSGAGQIRSLFRGADPERAEETGWDLRRMPPGMNQVPQFTPGTRTATAVLKPLEVALSDFASEFMPGCGIPFRIVVQGRQKALNLEVHERVFSIAREALSNAWRHAQATRVEAELTYSPQRVRLVVRDDGCGIDPALISSGRHRHLGLSGMSEMAKSIGARFRIWSRPMAGTRVEICTRYTLPISQRTQPLLIKSC